MRSHTLEIAAFLGLVGVLAACSSEERNFGEGGAGGTGGSGGAGGNGGTMTTGEGPQLVQSTPANGDPQASIEPYALLYFDRPVSFSAAAGKIRVSNDLLPDGEFAQAFPCPDNDVTCVAAVYPDTFTVAFDGRLPGGTKHTLVIDKSFPDPDGKTNDIDTTITYTTFPYDLNFFDDSGTIGQEAGGIDYDAQSQTLFWCGIESFGESNFTIRKLPLPGGIPASASTAAIVDTSSTGGPYTYGLDIYEGKLYASGTYQDRVYEFSNLGAPQLTTPIILNQTGLMAPPNHQLSQVESTALLNGALFFGAGYHHGGDKLDVLLRYQSGVYDVFLDFMGAVDVDQGFAVAPGREGENVLYLAAPAESQIHKIDVGSKTIVNSQGIEFYDVQMRTDSQGRLYVGTGSGLRVYDTSGTAGFQEVASRIGFDASRFAIREEGSSVHVYLMRFRDAARIGTTTLTFAN